MKKGRVPKIDKDRRWIRLFLFRQGLGGRTEVSGGVQSSSKTMLFVQVCPSNVDSHKCQHKNTESVICLIRSWAAQIPVAALPRGDAVPPEARSTVALVAGAGNS